MQETNSEAVGFRLSAQQQRLLDADHEPAVVQVAVKLGAGQGAGELRAALEAQVAQHEILRTTFPRQPGVRGRTQLIHEALAPEWSELTGPLEDALEAEASRPFDLDAGPLLRGARVAREPALVLTAHGACADLRSLFALAEVLAHGAGLDTEPVQYADYAEWRHELISGEDDGAADGRGFWSGYAQELPAPPRLLFAQPGARSGTLLRVAVELEPAELSAVTRAAGEHGASASEFVEASWHALLARLTGAPELLLAGWCEGREQPDLADALGAYAQPVPVISRASEETTFAEVLDQVRRARREAATWQDYATGEDLIRLEHTAVAGFLALPGELGADGLRARPSVSSRLLALQHERGLELWCDPAVHPEADVTAIAEAWRVLLAAGAADPARPLHALALLDASSRAALIEGARGPAPDPAADTPVHVAFARRAARAPAAPAAADPERELSYGELDAAANRLARALRAAGVAPGDRVGLALERSARLLEAILGVLKAGAAYVPLNPEHPRARIAQQLEQAGVRVVLSQEALLDRLPELPEGSVLCLDRDGEHIATQPASDLGLAVSLDDLAYVMFTSGSTGLPKGVAVTHGNLANYAAHMAGRLAPDPADPGRFGLISAISTDLGNTCVFPALVAGACVQVIASGAGVDAEAIAAELGAHGLDVLKITPSHLRGLMGSEHVREVLPRRTLVLGGEALSWELIERVRELAPDTRILNHYGPTEATIGCCAFEVSEHRRDSATAPIGWPLAGASVHVLDRGREPVPAGVPGELCVTGAGVAAGYVGRGTGAGAPSGDAPTGPFCADPFAPAGPGRMYRTGDRVRRLRDGALEFLGRIDDQVKIRGFRIEPGEIEAVLGRHPSVRQAAVVPVADERGELRLVAYLASSADPTVEELQGFLAESLPDYMIPAAFATLPSLPFTPSGKIDRRALPDLAEVQTRRGAEFVAPRDEVETQIAAIWCELLGVEQVGVFDDFFALGGHSLLATQAIMRIRRLHGEIPLRALLAAPTVAALADAVRAAAPAP